MMAGVANLAVILKAQTGQFTGAFTKAQKPVEKLTSSFGKMKMALAGLALGAVALRAASAIKSQVSAQLEAIDSAGKFASSMKMGVGSLIAWEHAAGLAGASAQDLRGGIEKLVKAQGKALDGDLAQISAFKMLGISQEQLAAMSTEEVFLATIEGIGKMKNAADQGRAGRDTLGTGYAKLLNLAAGGKAGLEASVEAAKKLGIYITETDYQTVANANDAWVRMSAAISGVWQRLTVQLAPAIEQFANYFTSHAKEIVGSIKDWVIFLGKAAVGIFAVVAATKILAIFQGALTLATTVYGIAVKAATFAMWAFCAHPIIAIVTAIAGVFVAAYAATQLFAKGTDDMTKATKGMLAAGDKERSNQLEGIKRLEELGAKQKMTNKEVTEAKSLVSALGSIYGDLGIRINETTGTMVGLNAGLSEAKKRMAEIAVMQIQAQIAMLQVSFSELNDTARSSKWWDISDWTGKYSENAQKRMEAVSLESEALRQRAELIKKGSQAALTSGTKGGKGFTPSAIQTKESTAIADAMAKINKQFSDFGKTDIQKQIDQLKALGATDKDIWKATAALTDLSNKKKQQKVKDTLDSWFKAAAQFGMSDQQKKLADLKASGAGMFDMIQGQEALALQDKQQKQQEQQEKQHEKQEQHLEKTKNLFAGLETPAQKYLKRVKELDALGEKNAGLLPWVEQAKKKAAADADLQASQASQGESADPKLMRAGSAAAQRFVFNQGKSTTSISKQQLSVAEQQLRKQEEMVRLLEPEELTF